MIRTLLTAAIALTIALPLAIPTPAHACMNSVRHQTDKQVMQVKRAESALRAGRHQDAIKRATSALPKADPKLRARANRVIAVALVRTKGQLSRDLRAAPVTDAAAQRRNIQWATQVLRRQASKTARPISKMHLAEALALRAETRADALAMLDELDEGGLIADGHGYALLAELRREHGDMVGGGKALANCQRIARDTQICNDVLQSDG